MGSSVGGAALAAVAKAKSNVAASPEIISWRATATAKAPERSDEGEEEAGLRIAWCDAAEYGTDVERCGAIEGSRRMKKSRAGEMEAAAWSLKRLRPKVRTNLAGAHRVLASHCWGRRGGLCSRLRDAQLWRPLSSLVQDCLAAIASC